MLACFDVSLFQTLIIVCSVDEMIGVGSCLFLIAKNNGVNFAVDVKVNGLQIVICIEYLMQLKDFFMKGMPVTDDLLATTSTQPTSESKLCLHLHSLSPTF